MAQNDRNFYSKLDSAELRRRLRRAEDRSSRAICMEAQLADMFCIQEIEAVLQERGE